MKGKLTDQISIQNINIVLFCIIRLDIVNNHIESKKVQCPFLQLLMIINKFCLGDFDHRKSTWSSVKIFQKFHRLFGFFSKLNLSRALTASLTISWKVWCEHWRHKTNKHIHLESFKVPRFSFSNIWDESRQSHILVYHSTFILRNRISKIYYLIWFSFFFDDTEAAFV